MRDLVSFEEKTSQIPLSNFQKDFLRKFEDARNNGKELFVIFPRVCGRSMILNIIKQFDKEVITK